MAKVVKTSLPAVQKVQGLALPAHLQEQAIVGVEALGQYVVLPRLKTVQKQANQDLLNTYNIGDLLLTPTMNMVMPFPTEDNGRPSKVDRGKSFYFTPLFFFVNWATLNPIQMKGKLPVVRYLTSNPADPIVAKCKSSALRKEPCPEDKNFQIRHVEQLNFVVTLQHHELAGMPFIMTFSKGEHFSGQKFCTLIKQRNASPFACVFEAYPKFRPGTGAGEWWGIDVCNPADPAVQPWVTAEEYEQYTKDFEEYKKLFAADKLRADETDLNEDAPDAAEAAATSDARAKERF